MVFGGVEAERLQLNEDTLWSGHPRDWNNPEAKQYLPEVRRLVLDQEEYARADEVCKKMQGPYNESYQPLGNLYLKFEGQGERATYRRQLDLGTAIARVTYRVDGVEFSREVLSSAVDQVLVVNLSCSQARRLNFSASMDSLLRSATQAKDARTIRLYGKAPAHADPDYLHTANPVIYDEADGMGMRFEAWLRVVAEGGETESVGNQLRIRNADTVTLLLAAATGYKGFEQFPDTPAEEIAAGCSQRLDWAEKKGYAELRHDHVEDYQKLFRRVTLDLGPSNSPDLPTDERLRAFEQTHDPQLLTLYFQYGRYLLISSSRPGTQPANLQGIWNELVRPPWSSNWTANINVQMNYWPAETCNLSECHEPLFDLIEGLRPNGEKTAQVNYGLGGWVSHHNIDLWRQTAPVGQGSGDPTWANWPMSGAWLCAHLWEHYRFTGDVESLRQRAYPLMKDSARFYRDWLVEDKQGRLTTCPSFSTENSFIAPDGKGAETSAGCTMDMALIRELFTHCIEAAQVLGVDAALAQELDRARSRLVPYQIGRYGQLQEWSKDFQEAEPGHRHVAHLYGVYPGDQITPRRTPELAQAARVSIERRLKSGGAYTGWSRAWVINLWARLEDGEAAHESIVVLLKQSTGLNLLPRPGNSWVISGLKRLLTEEAPEFAAGGVQRALRFLGIAAMD